MDVLLIFTIIIIAGIVFGFGLVCITYFLYKEGRYREVLNDYEDDNHSLGVFISAQYTDLRWLKRFLEAAPASYLQDNCTHSLDQTLKCSAFKPKFLIGYDNWNNRLKGFELMLEYGVEPSFVNMKSIIFGKASPNPNRHINVIKRYLKLGNKKAEGFIKETLNDYQNDGFNTLKKEHYNRFYDYPYVSLKALLLFNKNRIAASTVYNLFQRLVQVETKKINGVIDGIARHKTPSSLLKWGVEYKNRYTACLALKEGAEPRSVNINKLRALVGDDLNPHLAQSTQALEMI